MVSYTDVGRRHAGYAAAVLAVVALAQFTLLLTVALCAILAGVRWHMGTPTAFSLLACAGGPLGAALCVKLSHDTWSVRRSNAPPPPTAARSRWPTPAACSGGTPTG